MSAPLLSELLEREHHDIDGGIEEYAGSLGGEANDPAPLLRAMDALRRHIYLEEEFVFPPLKEAGMMMPIFVMLREHGEIWDEMTALDELLAGDTEADALNEACRTLLSQLDDHNAKEEPIIYPRMDEELSEDATERLRAFIDSGKMPAGWRCEQATR
ncbi:MAG: hemerythrin domain-containing protein [Leucobacter sp.]|nr:hemerythrin domain-containing protein [Leucobacter sp.]